MALQSLTNQTVSIYQVSSYDEYGRAVEGLPTSYSARFQKVQKSRMLPNGDNVTIEGIVYIYGEPSVNLNDKLVYGGNNYKVYSKTGQIDGQGNQHHVKLEVTKWQI